MNAMHLQAMDMISTVPDAMIVDVVGYLAKMQPAEAPPMRSKMLDFSKYTRKGSIPLGKDAQEWVAELRSNDRI